MRVHLQKINHLTHRHLHLIHPLTQMLNYPKIYYVSILPNLSTAGMYRKLGSLDRTQITAATNSQRHPVSTEVGDTLVLICHLQPIYQQIASIYPGNQTRIMKARHIFQEIEHLRVVQIHLLGFFHLQL
ncbi:hypothetical protein RchiOBHm_Chr4g0417631 [Rosa chinensis]|uniref:Uncharacterized protein n=1 Tax=Rosa chinensis TaxID=74649 RepID=A0A2P6QX68_ROSCH|nr:hypothetical protein RchiOBHm_Chr4g0417631 [Rosa chinensis]